MRKLMLLLAAAVFTAATAVAAPVLAGDYDTKPNLAVAAKGGWWEADVRGFSGAPAYGLELSADDPWTRMPVGKLRHMLSWNHEDGDDLRLDSAEWNVHWLFETRSGIWLGAGPGLGYVWTDGRDLNDSLGVQFGASATYFVGHALFGVESRYQWTEADAADNWLTMIKVGYVF